MREKLVAYLKLLRIPNLLIVALTLYAMRYGLVEPIIGGMGLELQMDSLRFLLLVLSAIFITAAGYIINDYFDTKTDRLNRPGRVVVDRLIPRRTAMAWHISLNVLGIALGIYLALYIDILAFGLLYLMATGILWFYSTTYKRQFLIGNLIVSLMTGAVPFLVVLFEAPLLVETYREYLLGNRLSLAPLYYWVGGFSIFAFFTNLIREIIKDTEDFEGDAAYGMNTLPVQWGIKVSKWVIMGLIFITVGLLAFIYIKYLAYDTAGNPAIISGFYLATFIILPFLYLMTRIHLAKTQKDYHFASSITKVIMLFGIGFAFLVRYIIQNALA